MVPRIILGRNLANLGAYLLILLFFGLVSSYKDPVKRFYSCFLSKNDCYLVGVSMYTY